MATFNKRGYKAPKEKEEKNANTFVEDIEKIEVDEKNSTTAKALEALDETASRTESFVAKNQNIILGALGGIALLTVGYLLYQNFVVEPKQLDAADNLFVAQQNFQLAVDGSPKADSLFNLVLNGSDGKFGVLKIAEEYSGTDAGNLAHYYAGIAYLNTGKYAEAITNLEKFKSKDGILSSMAIGAIGDANAQQNKMKEALEFYAKAANNDKNEFTTPRFLLKAAKTALALNNKPEALKYLTDIKDNYDNTPEAQQADGLLGLAQ
jgi:TolA-binding protein